MSQLHQRKVQVQTEVDNTGENLLSPQSLRDETTGSDRKIAFLGKNHWIFIFLLEIFIYYCCDKMDALLPDPLTDGQAGPYKFSEIRACRHLTEMASYGPKPSGSYAAEVLTKNYILKELERINVGLYSKVHSLDVDVQKPSGCFDLNLSTSRVISLCYKNITNIVAVLKPKSTKTDFSILVNCHFDSVPGSPGATDDLASCSIMLEILSVMSKTEKWFSHNVIFLFNGAEENFMQGSHGFITQHKLRHTVKAFINLEGAGAGGREFLFQSGPANNWMLHAYLNSASRPHGTVMAQELFESGVALSFTDYQIFRDYGRLSGLDIAFVKNGYLYHTEFDKPEFIPSGSLQRCGDNVLATLVTMANSPCVVKPCTQLEQKFVFFDILGLFVVQYPSTYATVLNYAICIFVMLSILHRFRNSETFSDQLRVVKENISTTSIGYTVADFVKQIVVHLISLICMMVSSLVMIKTVNILDFTMCWYNRPVLILPLYIAPPILIGFSTHIYLPQLIPFLSVKDIFKREPITFDVSLSMLALVLFGLTFFGIRSAYFVLAFIVFSLLRKMFVSILCKFSGNGHKNTNLLYVCHVIALTPASLLFIYGIFEILTFFIPLMGRSGTKTNPEFFIAAIGGFFALFVVLLYGSLCHISQGIGYLMKCCSAITVFILIVISVTPLRSPYKFDDAETPHWRLLRLQHVNRRITHENGSELNETGIWMVPFDYRGVRDLPVETFLQGSKPPYCLEADTYCGMPFSRPRLEPLSNTLWLSVGEIPPVKTVAIQLLSKEQLSPTVINYKISVKGSAHVTLFITPLNSWRIDSWTFTERILDNKQTYFLYLASVDTNEPWVFSLRMSNKNVQSFDEKQSKLLIGAASHELYGDEKFSKTLKSMIKTVKERRSEPELTKGHWKWSTTVDAFCSDYLAQYFK